MGLGLLTSSASPKPISPFVYKVAVYTPEALHASLRTGYLFNPKMTLILPFDFKELKGLTGAANYKHLGWRANLLS